MSDLIDRQAAIEILSERAESLRGEYGDLGGACRGAMRIIETLPSAEPERTAKVKNLDRRSETFMSWEGICTKCGAYTMHEMNYCFHCGARLEWE